MKSEEIKKILIDKVNYSTEHVSLEAFDVCLEDAYEEHIPARRI